MRDAGLLYTFRIFCFLSWLPSESSSHGSALSHGHGPQQGPQGDEEGQQAETADSEHEGRDPEGVRLHDLRAARHGVAQSVQGQAHTQVHHEEGGHTEQAGELSNVLAAMRKVAAKKD